MGYEKDRMIQEDDQGWRFSGGMHICWRCLSDPYLRSHVRANSHGFSCDFCERTTRKRPSTVPFDDVMEIIATAIRVRYNDANNETIPWDDEEHCHAGMTYSSYEIVRFEIPTPSEKEEVLRQIIDCLPDYEWCQRNFASFSYRDRYESSWESFFAEPSNTKPDTCSSDSQPNHMMMASQSPKCLTNSEESC